ncbi:Sporulation-specific protein [Wickerhamomyces ciferrii]|uniref:Sporulation-specific protein n=1 Tax=Wickerhamomyces ciferrii (strain ATCC 14091 / BCRC 22168 / CBS 111 / JCM 3599 / NBRC 0793 / NRRL Y-1031 F-60-10) TaxID=1206466 RepID=K0KCB7_WICCF|nr:Sporulation-specific protein [Wickerhamomyces ciferrii]CCH40541.1 Sporulation-specific protein [Wickerhamomyces ciferrii]
MAESTDKVLDSPSLDAISLDTPAKEPMSSPKSSPKSPNFSATDSQQGLSPSSPTSSPLLLAMDQITPLTSRDEDSAIYSDSDAGSQTSTIAARGRNSASTRDHKNKSSKTGRSSSRRRKSDSSEKSNRSVRSSSGQRGDKISTTTKIFRNLLILEESLRQQSQDQRILRRKFTAFLAVLAGLSGFCFYSLYGTDKTHSPFTKVILQFLFFFILVTLALFHLSGEYRRTIIIPRRFFTSTNKGLRQLNLRLVKVKTPIGDQFIDITRAILMFVVQLNQSALSYTGPLQSTKIGKWIKSGLRTLELRSQPRVGATDVKLMLNPRAFNSEIREAWELYRDEFWAREGSRRRHSISEESNNAGVLGKDKLMEKHRKERKDRRKSRTDDIKLPTIPNSELASSIASGIDFKQLSPETFNMEAHRRSI